MVKNNKKKFFLDSTQVCPLVPPHSPCPVAQLYDVTTLTSNPSHSATPGSPHRNRHRNKMAWTSCKECAKSDQSSDEVRKSVRCFEKIFLSCRNAAIKVILIIHQCHCIVNHLV